jgi:hypothetical protein
MALKPKKKKKKKKKEKRKKKKEKIQYIKESPFCCINPDPKPKDKPFQASKP